VFEFWKNFHNLQVTLFLEIAIKMQQTWTYTFIVTALKALQKYLIAKQ